MAAHVAALTGAGRKPASVTRALVAVRSLHRWCGSDAAVEVDHPEPVAADPTTLSEVEAAALVESVAGASAVARRDRALLEVLYATGASIPEVVGLSCGDVGGGLARFGGRRPRPVPLGGPAVAAVAAWLEPGGRDAMTRPGPGAGGALFLNQRGGRLSRQWAWAVVRAAGERVGLTALGPHVLRHSFAVHLARRGAPAVAVQQLLVGQPPALTVDDLVGGYRRWHPRARDRGSPDGRSTY